MTLDLSEILIIALATWRLAFAISLETLPLAAGEKFRKWANKVSPRDKDNPEYAAKGSFYDGLTCPLCLSIWLLLPIIGLWLIAPIVVQVIAIAGLVLWLHRGGR